MFLFSRWGNNEATGHLYEWDWCRWLISLLRLRQKIRAGFPTCSVVMWHYACRPPGNKPPIRKMKWAGKYQFPGFEVALSHECHFIPLTSLLEAMYRHCCQIWWRVWIEVDTWIYYRMNVALKHGCSFIPVLLTYCIHQKSFSHSLTYVNSCLFFFFGWGWYSFWCILNTLDLFFKIVRNHCNALELFIIYQHARVIRKTCKQSSGAQLQNTGYSLAILTLD